MELNETIVMMMSEDFKERFKAEYYQLKIRLEKLETMVEKYKAGGLNFIPKCPLEIFISQIFFMKEYLRILEERANIEGITL